jgi:cyclopropane-fatty-acyl-phospholipid synthase
VSTITKHEQHPAEPMGGNRFYHGFAVEEEIDRTSYHYEQDPEFYLTFTGSKWNVYSCSMWEEGFDATQAEEKKLDKMAELMGLQPGMHILDVGFGWGGPLVYLCEKYGVTGHGITISPKQIPVAEDRAARHEVDVSFELVHWKDLPEVETYDVVFSDEVITHFFELKTFFAKCHKVLKPGGMNVHKELHLSRAEYAKLGPLSEHVHQIYGYTGNYRPLYEEMRWLDETGFLLTNIYQISMINYHQTLDVWLRNMFEHRERLKQLTSPEFYRDFRIYLKAVRHIFTNTEILTADIVASRKAAN